MITHLLRSLHSWHIYCAHYTHGFLTVILTFSFIIFVITHILRSLRSWLFDEVILTFFFIFASLFDSFFIPAVFVKLFVNCFFDIHCRRLRKITETFVPKKICLYTYTYINITYILHIIYMYIYIYIYIYIYM